MRKERKARPSTARPHVDTVPIPCSSARVSNRVILSGDQILAELHKGLLIRPFRAQQLNPNSYNLRLHSELLLYDSLILDMRKQHQTTRIKIPKEGLVLEPHRLYLGRTVEYTESHNFVPLLEGRSSIARLGLCVHSTAGFGDIGFCGYWTLELYCVQPIRIYPEVEVCQIFYHTIAQTSRNYAGGKYQNNSDIQSSKMHLEFND